MGILFLIIGWVIVLAGIAWGVLAGWGANDVLATFQGSVFASGSAVLAMGSVLAPGAGTVVVGLLLVAVGVALRRLRNIDQHTHVAAIALDELNRRVGQELPRA